MNAIDVSHWQTGLVLSKLTPKPDMVIVKATEGLNYVDAQCNQFVEQAKALGCKIGFYHFARANSGKSEAKFFYTRTRNYFKFALPVLDFEDTTLIKNKTLGQTYIEEFVAELYKLSGVYPMFYCSASVCSMVPEEIANKCKLWVAGYPGSKCDTYAEAQNYKMPYNIKPWNMYELWQFTGTGKLKGYSGNLDLSIGHANAKSNNEITIAACEVILGKYGNGAERKAKLAAAGFDASSVQARVNQILQL